MRASLFLLSLALVLVCAGCNTPRVVPMFDAGTRDTGAAVDANRADAPGADAAASDTGTPVDASGPDMDASGPGVDASGPGMDASGPGVDASGVDAGRDASMPGDAALVGTSMQIAAIRSAAVGAMDLPVTGATVTYVRPLIGVDPAGFFVQADATGPALFVAVTPSTLSPVPVAGDVVSFRATMTATDHLQLRVTAITGFARTGSAVVSALVQDLSSAPDLVSGLNGYESEIVRVRGTLGAVSASGTGHQRAALATVGVAASPSLFFRAPDAIWSAFGLIPGCDVSVDATPLWRFDALAEPSAWDAADLVVHSCPRPRVVSASASSSTSVTVSFDQMLAPATVVPGAFTVTGGVVVSAAVASGAIVTLTTSALTPSVGYTVTVAPSVTSVRGDGISPTASTAMFTFGGTTTVDHLVINEVEYDETGTDSAEFVEILNRTGASVDLSRFALVLINGSGGVEYDRVALTGTLADGQYLVVASAATLDTLVADREIAFAGPSNLIQNGAPDAIALIDTVAGTLVDALSYEGAVTGVTITGVTGTVSLVEGTMTAASETDTSATTMCRRPSGTDTNDAASDWATCSAISPGAANP